MTEQTTKISHLLQMPVGQGTGGYTLYVKTYKKRRKSGENSWWQQCICQDKDGEEILVDVRIKNNVSLGREFKVIVGKIVEVDWLNKSRKALRVIEYTEPTQTADEWMEQADKVFAGELKTIRSKIKCLLACHNGPKNDLSALDDYLDDPMLDICVEKIMKG